MADSFREAAASNRAAAADRLSVDQAKKAAATKNPQADTFASNAANPTWVGGFDQKLNTPRTS